MNRNNPKHLQERMRNHFPQDFDVDKKINRMLALETIPSLILPFLVGMLADRLSASFCLHACSSLAMIGNLIFTLAVQKHRWTMMFVGRIIVGVGNGSVGVAASALLARHFLGREICMAFAIAFVAGTVAAFVEKLDWSLTEVLGLGVGLNVLASTAVSLACLLLDDVDVPRQTRQPVEENDGIAEPLLLPETEDESKQASSDDGTIDGYRHSPQWQLLAVVGAIAISTRFSLEVFDSVSTNVLMKRHFFRSPPSSCTLLYPDHCTSGELLKGENPSTNRKGELCPEPHYAPVIPSSINMTGYHLDRLTAADIDCRYIFWSDGCTRNYCQQQDLALAKSGALGRVPRWIGVCLSPLLGLLLDKSHRSTFFVALAPILLCTAYSWLLLSPWLPLIALVGFGFVWALYHSAILPLLAMTAGIGKIGTAFGLLTLVHNVVLSVSGFLSSSGETAMLYCFGTVLTCSFLGVWLFRKFARTSDN